MYLSSLLSASWYQNLPRAQQQLIRLSLELLDREKRLKTKWSDYSFILFPISKAYEGFLKEFLYQRGLISYSTFVGRRFRVGRSLNPDISRHHQDEWWLYDDVARMCGAGMARQLWDAWIECRNHIFHYFPEAQLEHSLTEIEKKVLLLIDLMAHASECEIPNVKKK